MEIYQTPKPWGTYEVLLDDELTKVKRITVYPGHRLSLQSHEHRQEQWTVIEGKLTVVLGDEQLIFYPGESVHIPLGVLVIGITTRRNIVRNTIQIIGT